MYDQSIVDQITWLETNEEKVELLNSVRAKLNAYEGEFVSTTLSELVGLFETTFYSFPGIDLDGDGTTDVELSELIENMEDLSINIK